MFAETLKVTILSLLLAAAALADVRINVATGVPDPQGKISVDVSIASDGESVGGFQNDIVFDHTVVRLESAADCRINSAIGTAPLGNGSGVATCAEDPTLGPCKTLSRSLFVCEGDPPPGGCPAEAPDYSRFRAIVAAIEVPNDHGIPDGVAYTCVFTVVNPAALPSRLFNTEVVVSDPFGLRLQSGGEDGGACVDEAGGHRCAPLRGVDQGCTIDFECASGNCDRCCGHQFNGICAAPRTATPTAVGTSTRTPSVTRAPSNTRTPLPTRTATATPMPQPAGEGCVSSNQCAAHLACSAADRVCCTSEVCPAGTSCRATGLAGYCVGEGLRPPGRVGIAEIAVSLRSGGEAVGGMQNDIIFDDRVLRIDEKDCVIDPAIGLFPLGPDGTSCLEDSTIGPCKNLSKIVRQCDAGGQANGCSLFRAIIAATAAPNNNPIPDGVLYRCQAEVLDTARSPDVCPISNVVVSTPFGERLDTVEIDCRVELTSTVPGPNGISCSEAGDCESGNCVDRVCCGVSSCPAGQSCSVSGVFGECSALRADGEGCNLGNDCDSRNCDLLLGSPSSAFRGACGPIRASTQQPGECGGADECESGNCVDGFCCDAESCAAGQFCNSGRCALPAEPGTRCTADEQCALGLCVDGTCCVTGFCPQGQSCGIPALGGICREPLQTGSPCTLGEQCPTGFCTDGVCCRVDDCPSGFVCSQFASPGECVDIFAEPGVPDGGAATPTPLAPRAGCAPGDCAPGSYCVNAVCCADAACIGSDRCDIVGFEGHCVPPLPEGSPCITNTDCSPGLACFVDNFNVRRCSVVRATPTVVPTGKPRPPAKPDKPPKAEGDNAASSVSDDGCQLSPRGTDGGGLWLLGVAGLFLLRVRRQRGSHRRR